MMDLDGNGCIARKKVGELDHSPENQIRVLLAILRYGIASSWSNYNWASASLIDSNRSIMDETLDPTAL